ncbi:putative FAD-linked oxidoreductase (plasmid) [Sulfitobacter sp. THAF37]|uniref:FAD-binding oxidoreductase n=1 Tax=Sulfitobacter sp. THAF37 TaxID=2587855 RepID=UPI0012690B8E|nr:FAD-binding oxidoreductase [Sulfitobacter sp. THAF37]QFT61095.1 putative FAD-linked oxidoreductase [Sulfitobacter sp. THAF37]
MPAATAQQDTLLRDLGRICGESNVVTGRQTDGYARDWRGQYPSRPLAVVRPGTTEDVSAILRLANDRKCPVVPIGGNTGLVGGTQTDDGLMVSLERMKDIRSVDPAGRTACVDAGITVEELNRQVAAYGLRFPLAFGAQGSAMIGGALSTNAGGANVLAFGMARSLCLGLEVVLPDGRILNDMVALRKNNTGYDLKQLFIGAEGTLGLITGAVVTLTDLPMTYATALISVGSIRDGLTALDRLRRACGSQLEAFEIMPASYLRRLKASRGTPTVPFSEIPSAAILVEIASSSTADCTSDEQGATPLTERLIAALGDCIGANILADAVVAHNANQRAELWRLRDIASEMTKGLAPVVAADVSVPLNLIEKFEPSLEDHVRAIDPDALIWTVGHLGDGNLHVVVCTDDKTPEHMARIRSVIDDMTLRFQGSFSAEHGIGTQKLASMAAFKSPVALDLMEGIKAVFDPNRIMNPGKVLPDRLPGKTYEK